MFWRIAHSTDFPYRKDFVMFLNDTGGFFLLSNSTDFFANECLHFRKSHFPLPWHLDRLLFRLLTPHIISDLIMP